MPSELLQVFWVSGLFVVLLFIVGLYCLLATFNLVRALIGLELLFKAVTLLLVVAGYVTDHKAQAQSMVITLIVIEVVVMTVAMGIVLCVHNHHKSLDTRKLRNLKG
jgi:NADH:ubiquinone oxidoreductase subunit K